MKLDIKLHKQDLPDEIKFSDKIAIDCEFTGLNVERDRLCLVQISNGKNDAHIIQLDKENYDAKNLIKILSDKTINKLFHFARADLLFIKKFSSKLNKKLISFFGLFQFSVENVNKVKYLIVFFTVDLIIFSTVFNPAL